MKKIDITKFASFQICEIFEIKRPKPRVSQTYEEGIFPFVSSGAYNNGLVKYVTPKSDDVLDVGNCISVSPLDGCAFYQPVDFLGRGGSGASITLLYNKNLNKYNALYICSVIRRICQKYGYQNLGAGKQLAQEEIYLPIDEIGNPNWQYMGDYIKDIEKKVQFSSVQFSLSSKTEKENVDCQKWKYFHLYDIFDIDMGTKLDRIKMKMDNPTIDFVGRANAGQGVTTKVNKIDGLEPYKSGCLTLALGGAYLGSCFIQKNDFYTSQNVIVLIPRTDMTFRMKQFISTSIFVESQLHYKAFIDELNPHIKTDFQFKLPVDENDNPDWLYMDNYISRVEEISKKKLEHLQKNL